jgi:branched-chain amino acid transport system ATP-binding protein
MLRARGLDAGYGELHVLKNITLHISRGEIATVIGANGAGKTTLLLTLAGALRPTAGEMLLDGEPLTGSADAVVARGVALVPEGRQVFSDMSVRDNLLLGAYFCRKQLSSAALRARLDRMHDLFPILHERASQHAGNLSGGEQQMLAIARALMGEPRLLLLDEPSLGLAPLVVKQIFRTLAQLREQGLTILLVEQNARAALRLAQRGYVLETGRIVLQGTPEELLANRDLQRAYLGKDYREFTD